MPSCDRTCCFVIICLQGLVWIHIKRYQLTFVIESQNCLICFGCTLHSSEKNHQVCLEMHATLPHATTTAFWDNQQLSSMQEAGYYKPVEEVSRARNHLQQEAVLQL